MLVKIKQIESKVEELKKSIEEKQAYVNKLVLARKNMLIDIKRTENFICQEDGAIQAYHQSLKLLEEFKKTEPEIVDIEPLEVR